MALEKAERAGAKKPEVALEEKLLTDINQKLLEWSVMAKAGGYPQSPEGICFAIKCS